MPVIGMRVQNRWYFCVPPIFTPPAGLSIPVLKHLSLLSFLIFSASIAVAQPAADTAVRRPTRALEEVEIRTGKESAIGLENKQGVQGFTVFEGKKNEVVLLSNISANTATNNARQIFSGVTGLNIWESDGAGLQLGIGGRGLSPNRTANFNTRQQGYDISADALGYPESYYTPSTEALDRIEVIRGAAALQYGTQFGGTVNFIFKKPPADKAFEYTGRLTGGSWGFLNSFNSFAGTSKNKKLSYYAFYQRKQGNGYRENSGFAVNSGFAQLNYQISDKSSASLEYTHMDYLAQQPGGLTDAAFERDARQSMRSRNWFAVDWNLLALTYTTRFSDATQFNIRTFALLARRQSLGNLERINVADLGGRRTLIDGQFKNVGTEARLVHRYTLGGASNQTLVTGVRLYAGRTTARQGDADSGTDAHFEFRNEDNVEGSDYVFPNYNAALFAENVFRIGERLTLTPGIRLEGIVTKSEGYYRQRVFDFAGNVVSDARNTDAQSRGRAFAIMGLGAAYKLSNTTQLYANVSQNYRAINFTDLRVQNPNFAIDSNLQDERGYTADLGIRGKLKNVFSFEVTAFYLYYNNRIGQVLKADVAPLYLDYRFRTNVAASRNIGIEAYGALNVARTLGLPAELDLTAFVNAAVLSAKYINSKDPTIEGREVEMVPPAIIRTGVQARWKKWRGGAGYNWVSQHFSDATNAVRTATAVEGLIPSYAVADLTASYQLRPWLGLEASCNNLFGAKYFTRRAESYPGPGIIPSDGQSFFGTVAVRL